MPRGSSTSSRSSRVQRSEEHTSELQSHSELVCRLLLEKKKDIGPARVCAVLPDLPSEPGLPPTRRFIALIPIMIRVDHGNYVLRDVDVRMDALRTVFR